MFKLLEIITSYFDIAHDNFKKDLRQKPLNNRKESIKHLPVCQGMAVGWSVQTLYFLLLQTCVPDGKYLHSGGKNGAHGVKKQCLSRSFSFLLG
jgi:hypothetical protein